MKLLLVCNPGGHFSTMMGLEKFWSLHHREWVTYPKFDTEALRNNEIVHWVIMQEARMLGRALINFCAAFYILYKRQPDLVISTGAGVAVPFVYASKFLGIKCIYIESISRSEVLSLSGRLVYQLVDEFYVQWPDITTRYDKAIYAGIVL